MTRLSAKRIGFAVLGGLASVSVLTAVAAELDDSGLARLYNLGVLEWIVPIVAGASVGVCAWLVLKALPEDTEASTHTEEACPACGRLILDDWRLCPHCGTLVEPDSTCAADAVEN